MRSFSEENPSSVLETRSSYLRFAGCKDIMSDNVSQLFQHMSFLATQKQILTSTLIKDDLDCMDVGTVGATLSERVSAGPSDAHQSDNSVQFFFCCDSSLSLPPAEKWRIFSFLTAVRIKGVLSWTKPQIGLKKRYNTKVDVKVDCCTSQCETF